MAQDTYKRHGTEKVGHIFGAHLVTHAVVTKLHIAHDTYDSHETETKVGHIFGANFATHATYDTYCT